MGEPPRETANAVYLPGIRCPYRHSSVDRRRLAGADHFGSMVDRGASSSASPTEEKLTYMITPQVRVAGLRSTMLWIDIGELSAQSAQSAL